MKKAMIALAGILSVMMLASCQKEVEIDGDVSLEKTSYEYSMNVEYTDATVESATAWNEDDSVKTWGNKKILKADTGTVSWDNETKSNVKKYELVVEYTGTVKEDEEEFRFKEMELIKCKDSWYLEDVLDANKVTVTGSPEDSSFTVTAKDWVVDDDEKYNFTLKFTRK